MVVLPEGEEILDVVCGDKDFWVISADPEHRAREAGEGRRRHEPESRDGQRHRLFVPADREERQRHAGPEGVRQRRSERAARPSRSTTAPRRSRSCRAQLARGAGRSRRRTAPAPTSRSPTYQQQYPATLQFVYGAPKYEKPFLVRSIWHDGQFTYIKADAHELPALYEVKDGKPALRELPGPGRHLRRAEGARPRLPGARQDAVRRSRSRDGEPWPTPQPRLTGTRAPSPIDRPGAARCPASRHADLADGGRRRRHAADHARRRAPRAAGAACATSGAAQAPSADRVARLSGPLARSMDAAPRRRPKRPPLGAADDRPTYAQRPAVARDARSDRGRAKAARVREPVRQQRRAEPAAGGQQPRPRSAPSRGAIAGRHARPMAPEPPDLDDVADAVVRATARAALRRASSRQRRSLPSAGASRSRRRPNRAVPTRIRRAPARSAPRVRCIGCSKAPSSTPS